MKNLKRLIDIAKRLANNSDHHKYKLGCIVFKKSRILGLGFNQLKTDPKSPHTWKHIHSEFAAIKNVPLEELKNSSVLVYMERVSNGSVGVAKPCPCCENMLRKVGVKQIYYTTNDGVDNLKI